LFFIPRPLQLSAAASYFAGLQTRTPQAARSTSAMDGASNPALLHVHILVIPAKAGTQCLCRIDQSFLGSRR
jgi:hypothetical protein